jgi:hypothetical protein
MLSFLLVTIVADLVVGSTLRREVSKSPSHVTYQYIDITKLLMQFLY